MAHQFHGDPRGNVTFQQVGTESFAKGVEVRNPPGSINVSYVRLFT
jgi:hypothetical protein